MLVRGDRVIALMLNPDYDVQSDIHMQYLKKFDSFQIFSIQSILSPWGIRWIYRLNKTNWFMMWLRKKVRTWLIQISTSTKNAQIFMQSVNADICVFEFGGYASRGRYEIFKAAKALGIPTVCLPHGLNIFLNRDVTLEAKKAIASGTQYSKPYSQYDAYVYQSTHHRELDIAWGIDPEICHVLGSARFCPEWQRLNSALHEALRTSKDVGTRLKVVFVLPHWDYNVDLEKTIDFLVALSDEDWIYLVIKDHTYRTSNFPHHDYSQCARKSNVEIVYDTPSVSLVEWADTVITFSSSIGIEALLQDKFLIVPTYLHSNQTIYDESAAVFKVENVEMAILLLHKIHTADLARPTSLDKALLFARVIYGAESVHDVLDTYYKFLHSLIEKKE
jgi:hypothetical protein